MASTRMIEKASDDYRQAVEAVEFFTRAAQAIQETGSYRGMNETHLTALDENAEDMRAQLAQIRQWLESAQLGYSDRDCEFHSGYSPRPRTMRRATRHLAEVTA